MPLIAAIPCRRSQMRVIRKPYSGGVGANPGFRDDVIVSVGDGEAVLPAMHLAAILEHYPANPPPRHQRVVGIDKHWYQQRSPHRGHTDRSLNQLFNCRIDDRLIDSDSTFQRDLPLDLFTFRCRPGSNFGSDAIRGRDVSDGINGRSATNFHHRPVRIQMCLICKPGQVVSPSVGSGLG